MATSSPTTRSFFVAVMFACSILGASCAQVTGLSDDYRYDLAANSATGDAGADGAAFSDGSASDARSQCSQNERNRASMEISNAGGDTLNFQCRQCMASSCCSQIDACAKSSDCENSMQCVFNCLKDNGSATARTQCVNNCRSGFLQTVGACIQSNCAAPTCQL